jgi:signal transduction histidine kinase
MSQQYLELAELAGGFIHELKNHINTLSLHLQLLAEDLDPPETPRECRARDRVNKLTDECRRLVELSHDFLRFARADTPTPIPTDLAEVVTRMVDFLTPTARAQNIDIVWHTSANLPEVNLDVDLFEKALLNLMLNAVDAMPEGGTLTLQARTEDDRVRLDVIDTGYGIPAEMLPEVFKPFVTTKPNGNGLGLATAKKIVAAHGGDISVVSQPGHGTRFSVILPAIPGTAGS